MPKSGVSMTPGLTALTRMRRSISSEASVRAKLRKAALLAETAEAPAVPASSNQDVVRLYRRWQRTGNRGAGARLYALGVVPPKGDGRLQ